MALSTSVLSGELSEAMAAANAALSNDLRVALPGIIQSFDPNTVTCEVSPAMIAAQTLSDGSVNVLDYPLLVDVPVVFPRGGGCTLTFPLKKGDECLVVFADRAIDFWWQSGGIQKPVDARQHSLSDAFVIPGPQSQAHKISAISTSAVQLRSDDGAAYLELNPQTHDIALKTPGKLTANIGSSATLVAPIIELTGEVKITGNMSITGNVTHKGNVATTGNIGATGDIRAAAVSLLGHVHGGVDSGNSNTGSAI